MSDLRRLTLLILISLLAFPGCSRQREWSSEAEFRQACLGKTTEEMKALVGPPDGVVDSPGNPMSGQFGMPVDPMNGGKFWYYNHLKIRDAQSGTIRQKAEIAVGANGRILGVTLN